MSEELYGQPSNEPEAGYQPMPPATPLPDDDKEQTYSSDERGLAFCDDDGQLDTDLIRKVSERDTELDAAEQAFWLIHNYKPGFRHSELTGIYKLIYQKSGRLWVWKTAGRPSQPSGGGERAEFRHGIFLRTFPSIKLKDCGRLVTGLAI